MRYFTLRQRASLRDGESEFRRAIDNIDAPLPQPGARQQPKPFSIAVRGDVVEQGDHDGVRS
jgi:hypothetical protein